MSNDNTQDENIPIHLTPARFLAMCFVRTIAADKRVIVSGVEDSIEHIKSEYPNWEVGTSADLDDRFKQAIKIFYDLMISGTLKVSLNPEHDERKILSSISWTDLSDDDRVMFCVRDTISMWQNQLNAFNLNDAAA